MPIAARDWQALSRLLDTALSLPPGDRESWLQGLEGEDESLKVLLHDLISRKDLVETRGFLETLPKITQGQGISDAAPPDTVAGEQIGPYRLERALGSGGMGSVWLAERVDGVLKRRVALKLPHVAGPRSTLAARMDRERNILAALEHPNIARLYDAGIAADGRPYLALEYVEGEPIDRYCTQHRLSVAERLGLVLQVARAVAYAHQHLIVHRDLKPTNVLVDADGQVHLLDFGIAKLLDADAAEEAALTRLGGAPLTPEYASPEQLRGERVSTASDVYSLGVVLFELLTLTRPYTLGKGRDVLWFAQASESREPPRPSAASKDPAIARRLRGDLDTIVQKALKAGPEQRYATIAEFADDLQRYLRGEPVRAQPDTLWYRTRKIVARNKLAVGAIATVVLALAAGMTIALWQANRARAEQRTSLAVEQFLTDIFRANSNDQADPAKARETPVRELLRKGAQEIGHSLHDAPASKLRVLGTLAQMHSDLQMWDESVALNRERVALGTQLYGRDDPRVVDLLIDLSDSMIGSRANAEREPTLTEALRILDGRGDTESLRRARLVSELSSYYSEHDTERALQYAEQSVQILQRYPPSTDLVEALVMQAWLMGIKRQYPDAELGFRHAIEVSEQAQGKGNAHLPRFYGYLAEEQYSLQKFSDAEASLRRGLQIARTLKGEADGETLNTQSRLGMTLVRTARTQEGLAELAQATATVEKTRGKDDSLYTPMIEEIYGRSLAEAGRLQDGLRYLGSVVAVWRRYRADSNYLFPVLEEDAAARIAIGDFAAAQAELDEAQHLRDASGDRLSNLNGNVSARIALLLATHRTAEAERAVRDLYLPPGVDYAGSLPAMEASLLRAEVDLALDRAESARSTAAQVYAIVAGSAQRRYLKRIEARAALDEGRALQRLGQHGPAVDRLQDAVDRATEVYDRETSPVLADTLVALADALIDLHRIDEARVLEARARALQAGNKELGPQYRQPLAALSARLHT
jgi:eukaryotic-like serine/threonine-protein kinase